MKKIYFILVSFIFLTGCVQSVALLGPAFTIVKTGSIHQAVVGESINQGIKKETGKNVSEHAMSLFPDEVEVVDCDNTYSNGLQKIFFEKSEDPDCKEIQ